MSEKAGMVKKTYETNFGTAYDTYKIAVTLSPDIRLQDVKDYLNKLESVQTHFIIRNITVLFPVSLYLDLKLIYWIWGLLLNL